MTRASRDGRHTWSVTPVVARRLLYAIVVACLALTAGAALIRPVPPAANGPQHPVAIPKRLPFEVPVVSLPPGVVIVPMDGSAAQSIRMGVVVPVHGLPGQVGANP